MWNEIVSFIKDNLTWFIVGAALLILLVTLGIIFLVIKSKKHKSSKAKYAPLAAKSEYLAALGGEENVIEKSIVGSRIAIKLADFEKADPKKLLEIGVASYIRMSDKLTLVCKDNAEQVYDRIFN